jgi:hypothetical protein
MQKVMSPVSQGLDCCIELFIVSAIFCLDSFSFSLKKAIGRPSWLKTPPMATPEASHSTVKSLSKSGRVRIGASSNSFLELFKAYCSSLGPIKYFSSGAVSQRSAYTTEISNEPLIKVY